MTLILYHTTVISNKNFRIFMIITKNLPRFCVICSIIKQFIILDIPQMDNF